MNHFCFYYNLVDRHVSALTMRGISFNATDIARRAHLPVRQVTEVFAKMDALGLLRDVGEAESSNTACTCGED